MNILTGRIVGGIGLNITGPADLGSQKASLAAASAMAIANGVLPGQCDLAFFDQRTLAGSTSEEIDLAGVIAGPFGATITFVEVCGLFVSAAAANGGNIIVGNAAANQFVGPFGAAAHTLAIDAGERLLLTNLGVGWPVTAGTADKLKIDNSDGSSAVYDIAIIGRSA